MERISDEIFIKNRYDYDKIIALKICDGDFYLIGYMEDADHYKIKKSKYRSKYLLDKDMLMIDETPKEAIETNSEYDSMEHLYVLNGYGVPVKLEDSTISAYEKFLSLVENHGNDPNDHDIFITDSHELAQIIDSLKDGEYVFIFRDFILN